jgi:2-dehydro-3-deoxygalactonokinase
MKPDWIAVDWGTSSLRVWAMSASGEILAEGSSPRGMGTLRREEFEGALLDLIDGWLTGPIPIVACGMVGARQGWVEAAYRAVPCAPVGLPMTRPEVHDKRLLVQIVPGLSQAKPADVMRGEETQIAGFLHRTPDFDGVLALPGTHTKWVRISAGEVVGFQTVMTGELFALLSTQSVLRHSVAPEGLDETAFDAGVAEALAKPEALTARLFSIRAESLVAPPDALKARSRLSGLLIGAELSAVKGWWLGLEVALIGAGSLSRLYARALATQGVSATMADVTDCTLGGLKAARHLMRMS